MAPPFTKPHVEPSLKRVRVLFGGQWIVDTKKAKLVWQHTYYPVYFFEKADVPEKYLRKSNSVEPGTEATFDIVVEEKVATAAASTHAEGDLAGLIKIKSVAADAWFEEDEQVFGHPKDPYKRVDVLQSSRHVRVEFNGVEVANTTKPRLLFETGLPVRTYMPKTDCRMDLLVGTELTTECPYKGVASYYSIHLPDGKVAENVVWWYRTPQAECIDIKGYVAFYDEKLDIWVDGVKQTKP